MFRSVWENLYWCILIYLKTLLIFFFTDVLANIPTVNKPKPPFTAASFCRRAFPVALCIVTWCSPKGRKFWRVSDNKSCLSAEKLGDFSHKEICFEAHWGWQNTTFEYVCIILKKSGFYFIGLLCNCETVISETDLGKMQEGQTIR